MFISELYIERFRLFQNNSIKLGKYITAISGFNATGKSTVLGLLGHCGELKLSKGRPLLHSAFKAELGEILKFSKPYDEKMLISVESRLPITFLLPLHSYCIELFGRNTEGVGDTGLFPRELLNGHPQERLSGQRSIWGLVGYTL